MDIVRENYLNTSKTFRGELAKYDSLRPFLVRFIYNYHSECTKRAYRGDLIDFLNYFSRVADSEPGKIIPSDVNEMHIIAWKNILLSRYSKRSVNRKLASLAAFFRFLEIDKAIISSPMNRIKRLPAPKEFSTKDFSDEDVQVGMKMVLESRNIRHIIIIYIFLYTGLRCSEAMSLSFKNIIEISGEKYFDLTSKGTKKRLVFINQELMEKINDYENYILSSLKAVGLDRFEGFEEIRFIQSRENFKFDRNLFSTRRNLLGHCSVKTVYLVIEKYFGKGSRPHQLRSTVIGRLIDSGVTLTSIAHFVGHSDIKTTHSYYKRKVSLNKSAGRELNWN